MRIIKPGREPKKEVEQTCERCGCVFTYTKQDVNYAVLCGKIDAWVFCPCCETHIMVEP